MNNNFDDKNFTTSESYYDQASSAETAQAETQEVKTEPAGAEPIVVPPVAPAAPQENPELHKYEVISLVLGILALVLGSCCCLNLILAIISMVYASKVKKLTPNGKLGGMALAGWICSIIAIVISVLYVLIVVFSFFLVLLMEGPEAFETVMIMGIL